MFDEPTKGVDVGAKAEIYKVIGDLAAEGLGVVVVSSYLPEVLGLADRVLVMREGTVVGELPAAGATEEDVLHLASGTDGGTASALGDDAARGADSGATSAADARVATAPSDRFTTDRTTDGDHAADDDNGSTE
jgi:ribose transport system ATP-binding protein/rhamnose transport system ATP-binding protein